MPNTRPTPRNHRIRDDTPLVTFWNFVAMALGAGTVLLASRQESLPLFLVGFILLFVFSGIGNGSTYKMIPAIFRAKAGRMKAQGADAVTADREALRMSGALIGIAGAIGAFGECGRQQCESGRRDHRGTKTLRRTR